MHLRGRLTPRFPGGSATPGVQEIHIIEKGRTQGEGRNQKHLRKGIHRELKKKKEKEE